MQERLDLVMDRGRVDDGEQGDSPEHVDRVVDSVVDELSALLNRRNIGCPSVDDSMNAFGECGKRVQQARELARIGNRQFCVRESGCCASSNVIVNVLTGLVD